MNIRADGILRHRFHGVYSAGIALQFENAEHARLALSALGNDWKVANNPIVLVWSADTTALETVSDLLEKFGANREKIASIKTSIDHGEPFEVLIPLSSVPNPNQTELNYNATR